MTQADGTTPTALEVRLALRIVKPRLEALEAALTAAARLTDQTRAERRYEVLATLSEAHASLDAALSDTRASLGLPYDRVIAASYTAMFGPDD